MKKTMKLSTALLFTLSAQAMQQQPPIKLVELDEAAIKALAQEFVHRAQDPEYARQENAIDFYLSKHQYIDFTDIQNNVEESNAERREKVRTRIAEGRLAIGPNGYLSKTNKKFGIGTISNSLKR